MIKRVLKWTGIGTGSLIFLLFICYGLMSWRVSARMSRQYAFAPELIAVPEDTAAIERGRHLTQIKGCVDCHGDGLGGRVMIDDGAVGRFVASNLTAGKGGLPAAYGTREWMMALRHGIARDGRPLLLMPSQESAVLSEQDLAAVIAYCRQLPPVDRELPASRVGPLGRILGFFGKIPLLSVEAINHSLPIVTTVDTNGGIAQGEYLSVTCITCHRPNMKGGPGLVPGQPQIPDITGTGHVGRWTEAQFKQVLRTGKTPSGHQMNSEDMPWKMTAKYSDKELAALYAFLRSKT